MDKILFIMVLGSNPQMIVPMDSAADCIATWKVTNIVHDKMLWCGRGGCSGPDIQASCWDPKQNKAIEIPIDKK